LILTKQSYLGHPCFDNQDNDTGSVGTAVYKLSSNIHFGVQLITGTKRILKPFLK